MPICAGPPASKGETGASGEKLGSWLVSASANPARGQLAKRRADASGGRPGAWMSAGVGATGKACAALGGDHQ